MLDSLPNGHTFFYKSKDGNSCHITLPEDCTRDELLEAFEHYLRAAGYGFRGSLDFVDLQDGELEDDSDDPLPEDIHDDAELICWENISSKISSLGLHRLPLGEAAFDLPPIYLPQNTDPLLKDVSHLQRTAHIKITEKRMSSLGHEVIRNE